MSADLLHTHLEPRTDTLGSLMAVGELPGRAETKSPPRRAAAPAHVEAESQPVVLAPAEPTRTPNPITPARRVQRLSIVVPARNEELNLPALLDEIDAALRQWPCRSPR